MSMDKRMIFLGILLLLAVVLVSGCSQPPSAGDGIKSQGDVKTAVQNITADVRDLGNTLNELENILG